MDVPDSDETQVTLVRPFIDRARPLRAPASSEELEHGAAVRAYAMTGGRSRASVHLEFETMLQATATGRGAVKVSKFERADILRLCVTETLSVAELSARLNVPIGVVRVVAADLLSEDLLEAFHPSTNVADDVLLITRLIAGVRAL